MDIYLNCPDMLDTVVENICQFERESFGEEPIHNHVDDPEYDMMYIGCQAYSMFLESTESDDLGYLKEDYGIDVTVDLDFKVMRKNLKKSFEHVWKLMMFLSEIYPGDIACFSDGGRTVYKKTKDELYIDYRYWELRD